MPALSCAIGGVQGAVCVSLVRFDTVTSRDKDRVGRLALGWIPWGWMRVSKSNGNGGRDTFDGSWGAVSQVALGSFAAKVLPNCMYGPMRCVFVFAGVVSSKRH